MKNYLFLHRYKMFATLIFWFSFITLIITELNEWRFEFLEIIVFSPANSSGFLSDIVPGPWEYNNIQDEILIIIAVMSGIVMCFSKEKIEDELIKEIRKSSLIWALYVNYTLFIIVSVLIYGMPYIKVLVLNIFTPLIVFYIRFQWMKYRLKTASDEE
ncbi:hypothetical protein [Nonlabens sp.]|mgnify:CR=1 FL=1|uniref:hypothetical protein n=1 Tax=Nonlabens sp. TaxID=1888209 RepID=UPI003F696126